MAYLIDFAKSRSLEYRKDSTGNVVIRKGASPGMENRPVVVLQSHVDMVCEKRGDVNFHFDTDPIRTRVEDGWVRAEGTTLGADCGIGMAAELAVLDADDLAHGPVECLFTVDEETGLTGAFGLGEGMLSGKYLINLDSEDEGQLFIGCAGGIDTVATMRYRQEEAPKNFDFFRIDIGGLLGGHSGDDIDKGRANSNKLLARFLWLAARQTEMRLVYLDGGNLRNAIPREAFAVFGVPVARRQAPSGAFRGIRPRRRTGVRSGREVDGNHAVRDAGARYGDRCRCPAVFAVCPVRAAERGTGDEPDDAGHGRDLDQSGVGQVRRRPSDRDNDLAALVDRKRARRSGRVGRVGPPARRRRRDAFGRLSGLGADPESHLLAVTIEAYEKLFGNKPLVRSIHAGLECGLFLRKYPWLEMVSFGPTLRGVHSPDERLEIASVDKFWKLLTETLKMLE